MYQYFDLIFCAVDLFDRIYQHIFDIFIQCITIKFDLLFRCNFDTIKQTQINIQNLTYKMDDKYGRLILKNKGVEMCRFNSTKTIAQFITIQIIYYSNITAGSLLNDTLRKRLKYI